MNTKKIIYIPNIKSDSHFVHSIQVLLLLKPNRGAIGHRGRSQGIQNDKVKHLILEIAK
ncbi:MAG: hypothetical protein Harvfovirus32_2 [Harvfovirus sp.]|uniref:Uncharacterized protein n=1 Tax=Harvfovirus sp. TaxID=2487768 RepID=A0A3G5A2F1_9VIRU|nr:MAG: hypothetical protein Harvfovirus32_2 [Harvfovirus sp.]